MAQRRDPELRFEEWSERAAILEHCAELSLEEAEREATRELFRGRMPQAVRALLEGWRAARAAWEQRQAGRS
ncbi:MAG: hypothetical protein AB7N76_00260 [Planctomycetota bacterium]